jgi:hypothetical protein
MSGKGPFGAVIDTLNFCLLPGDLRKHTEKMIAWPKEERNRQARIVIKILDAVGKINKGVAIGSLDDAYTRACFDPFGYESEALGKIRALIEELPDVPVTPQSQIRLATRRKAAQSTDNQ